MDPKIGINRPRPSQDFYFNTTKMNTKKFGFGVWPLPPLWTNFILSFLHFLDDLPHSYQWINNDIPRGLSRFIREQYSNLLGAKSKAHSVKYDVEVCLNPTKRKTIIFKETIQPIPPTLVKYGINYRICKSPEQLNYCFRAKYLKEKVWNCIWSFYLDYLCFCKLGFSYFWQQNFVKH